MQIAEPTRDEGFSRQLDGAFHRVIQPFIESAARAGDVRPFPPIVDSLKTRQRGTLRLLVQAILPDGSVALEFVTDNASEAEEMR
jgi:hypothetical protein